MFAKDVPKRDGRMLTLYARADFDAPALAPSPSAERRASAPHMRFHPLLDEWVTYAPHRQGRTFLPARDQNPLAPTRPGGPETEVPDGAWDIAVFENRFPSLALEHTEVPTTIVPTRSATGRCEVVVFTQDDGASLATLPLSHIALLLEVWGDRTTRLAATGSVGYVLPFENRGAEVGVTLHHPHGQIYGYPEEPPIPRRIRGSMLAHYSKHGRGLLERLIAQELEAGERVLYEDAHAVAFLPACARYPYEVWVAPLSPAPSFSALDDAQRMGLARALKTTLLKYDALWDRPMPYLMAWYQAPTLGVFPECHVHAQIWPAYRTEEKLKYLAGTELAGGMFAMDTVPEDTARVLREVRVAIDEDIP